MTPQPEFTFRRFVSDQSGQMIPIVAFLMVTLIAMTGFAVDLGRILYANRQLQSATDAAALAGASSLPSSSAATVATLYSALPGKLNYHSNMPGVSMMAGYPKVLCLDTLTSQGMACSAPGNGNALAVKEQVTLDLTFLKVVGLVHFTIGASATASMRGSTAAPYNVALVVDTTASMQSKDTDSNCNNTRISCALSGVQTLLNNLSPCPSGQACGAVTNGNVANAIDRVSLYTFPGVTSTAQAKLDYDCSSSTPAISPYTFPTLPTYQIVDFSSDYRSSDTASLTSTSNLVRAAGATSNCTGMQAIGGVGTYYASVIYQAQADLALQAAAHPGTQNVMIILGDGDSGTTASNMSSIVSKVTGLYPSSINQCAQAVTAAGVAKIAGTYVYTVAYGANASGCSTDKPAISPCDAMRLMASDPSYFFSDYTASAGSGSCISASHSVSGLNAIFTQIANNMTVGRLIPDNTN